MASSRTLYVQSEESVRPTQLKIERHNGKIVIRCGVDFSGSPGINWSLDLTNAEAGELSRVLEEFSASRVCSYCMEGNENHHLCCVAWCNCEHTIQDQMESSKKFHVE